MKKTKMIFLGFSAIYFFAVFIYFFNWKVNSYSDEPYQKTYSIEDWRDSSDGYIKLYEIENGAASLSIEGEGKELVTAGDTVNVGRPTHVLLGNFYEGTVKILSVTDTEVTAEVNIQRTAGFFTWYAFLILAFSGGASYIFYQTLLGLLYVMGVLKKAFGRMRRERRKRSFKVVGK